MGGNWRNGATCWAGRSSQPPPWGPARETTQSWAGGLTQDLSAGGVGQEQHTVWDCGSGCLRAGELPKYSHKEEVEQWSESSVVTDLQLYARTRAGMTIVLQEFGAIHIMPVSM